MFEYLIIAVLVFWSTIVVFKKVFPKTAGKVFMALSNSCLRLGWHGLANWLKPKMTSGCGGSCGCGSETEAKSSTPIQTVKWR